MKPCALSQNLTAVFGMSPCPAVNQFYYTRGLWPVLVHQLEQLSGSLAVQGGVELVHRWGHLKAGLKDNLLPLQTDVLGPLDGQGRRCHLLPLLSLFGDHCSSLVEVNQAIK